MEIYTESLPLGSQHYLSHNSNNTEEKVGVKGGEDEGRIDLSLGRWVGGWWLMVVVSCHHQDRSAFRTFS